MNRRKLIRSAFVVADLVILVIACRMAASSFAPAGGVRPTDAIMELRPRLQDIAVGALFLASWATLFWRFGLYRQRYLSFMRLRPYHLLELVKATSLGTLLLVGASFLANFEFVTLRSVAMFWLAVTLGTILIREALIRVLAHMRMYGRNLRHLLIVGTNARAEEFARRVQVEPELGYTLRGFVDNHWAGREPQDFADPGIVARLDDVGRYLRDHVVDEVLIALPMATLYRQAAQIVEICEEHGIVVHFVPGADFLNIGSSTASFDTLDDQPVITLVPPPMRGWQLVGKRVVDVIGAAALIVVLAPLLLVVALAVKLTSDGPIFFVQDRVGLNKRIFPMIKFRTMVSNAEALQGTLEHLNEASGPVFKIERDPRVTRVGAFLRQTSLDELPQLFNVLRGDMSLVGPRPLPLRDYAGFSEDWHRRRFSVRPGITCLWQVQGRSSIPFDQWMQLDMEYISRWSLWLDVKILLETIRAVFAQRGAV